MMMFTARALRPRVLDGLPRPRNKSTLPFPLSRRTSGQGTSLRSGARTITRDIRRPLLSSFTVDDIPTTARGVSTTTRGNYLAYRRQNDYSRRSVTNDASPETKTPEMFHKVLIANRGEIACRVMRTCTELGIKTVALYSVADGPDALHASLADEAYLIGDGPEATRSYLLGEEVLDIASRSGAQAIHPGYGFLSENAAFANACANHQSNLTFIGPPSSAITAMGSKSQSKEIMINADVPCTPGYHGNNQDPQHLYEQANDMVGYPCLIKATAGGGGKGMRLVHSPADFLSALDSCKRESLSSFGDDTVILERYLVNPRHVEVQVCADTHGNVVHLNERDCSVQRRHQKVLEEAPAPGLSEETRSYIGDVAVRAAKAVGYVGAGTVEFLMDPSSSTQEFYFCEMNTRLQVEHPVTEYITGVDLVEWQLRVACGETLPIIDQGDIPIIGHAIEARVYAENPSKNFLPATGKLRHLRPPPPLTSTGGGIDDVRVDTGVREGDTVSVYYDPMISKLITHAPTRSEAIDKLVTSLRNYQVVGLPTNLKFLELCADHPAFREGGVGTGFLEDYADDVRVVGEGDDGDCSVIPPSPIGQALISLSVLLTREGRVGLTSKKDEEMVKRKAGPWSNLSGSWRLGGLQHETTLEFKGGNDDDDTGDDGTASSSTSVRCLSKRDGSFIMETGGGAELYHVRGTLDDQGNLHANIDGCKYNVTSVVLQDDDGTTNVHLWSKSGDTIGMSDEYSCSMTLPGYDKAAGAAHSGSGNVKAPMPGKVTQITRSVGDSVSAGDVLLVLEAMKMEHSITSPGDGVITKLGCSVGEIVNDGNILAVIE